MRSQKLNNQPRRILMLTLNVFKTTGGVQKVCRTFCRALMEFRKADPAQDIQVLSAYDTQQETDHRYISDSHFKGFGQHKVRFGRAAFSKGINSDVLIISHLNLLYLAICIKIFNPRVRLILLAHGVEIWGKLPLLARIFLQKQVETWCVSRHTKQIMMHTHGIKPERLKVLNNCLDPFFILPVDFYKPVQLLKRYGLTTTQPILLSLTRLEKTESLKGYDLVLKTIPALLQHFPNLHYLLAGKADPSEKERVLKLAAKLGLLAHVSLVDFIEEKELSAHYTLADVFVLPSSKEGFGLVFIEAAACGAKIVAGNRDGSTDALLDGLLGTMIDPEDAVGLEVAITQALKQRQTADQAKKIQLRCLEHFSFRNYVQRIKKELLNE